MSTLKLRSWLLLLRLLLLLLVLAFTPSAARAQTGPSVTGTISDENGGTLPGATITLLDTGTNRQRETVADASGHFAFDGVAPGRYSVRAELSGFQPATVALSIDGAALPPIKIPMKVAFEEDVTVTGATENDPLSPDNNADATELDPEAIRELPTDSQDVLSLVANFLAPVASLDGTSVVIDGSEGGRLDIPASAIHRVFTNRNPYSAEFKRPGKARVEIVTEHGSRRFYRGTMSLFVRNAAFDARHALALAPTDLDRRLFDGTLGGPLPGKGMSFFASAQRFTNSESAIVNAQLVQGPLVQNVPTSERRTTTLGRFDWRPNKVQSLGIRYDRVDEDEPVHGVGGLRLAEQARATRETRQRAQAAGRSVLSSSLMNDMRVDLDRSNRTDGSAPRGPAIVVAGAFTGGAGQTFRTSHDTAIQFQDILAWSPGRQHVRVGVRVRPQWIDDTDASNFGGTFEFASLSDFARQRPTLFRINRGVPLVSLTRHDASVFAEDTWRAGSHLTVSAGVRGDWDSIDGLGAVVPRLSLAFAPGGGRTIVRGGLGLYSSSLPDSAVLRAARVNGTQASEIVIRQPSFPDPFARGTAASTVPSLVRIDPAIAAPSLVQAGGGVERVLWRKTSVSADYQRTNGRRLFRSIDVNAPFPGTAQRPDPGALIINQIESTGTRRSDALTGTFRGRIEEFSGTIQYVWSKTIDDTPDLFTLPADSRNPGAELGPAGFDRRHRLTVAGKYDWDEYALRLGMLVTLASGAPFDITTGTDDNQDSVTGDRPPGVTRNTGRGPGLAQVDLRLTKLFHVPRAVSRNDPELKKRSEINNFELTLDVFNALNRANYTTIVGVVGSPLFNRAVAAKAARTFQLSARYRF